jgi:HAD superfamily hydrolase (TIGR01490 family)
MALAIFDLDHTLLADDSDHLWGLYLVKQGVVDGAVFQQRVNQFYADYQAGILDMAAYVACVTEPLLSMNQLERDSLRAQFLAAEVEPILQPKAFDLLNRHRLQGDYLMIITATNEFIAQPIAKRLGVDAVIATQLEEDTGYLTGRIVGVPSFQAGKVERLHQWLASNPNFSLENSYFYSDSVNDLPLLEQVTFPCIVDADEKL